MNESANPHGFKRDDVIPATTKQLWIIRLSAGQTVTATAISESVWGIWTHWSGNTSEPCFSEKDDCPGCKRGYPRRWKGYCHVLLEASHVEAFVELTPLSARMLMDRLPQGKPLRGIRFTLTRDPKNKKGRLHLQVDEYHENRHSLPKPKDPAGILEKLWGLSDIPRQADPFSVQ